MIKNLNNLSSFLNQKTNDLETWYAARYWVLEYYRVCSNDDSGLTLTYFRAMSNLVPFTFVIGEKGKTMDFSETIVTNRPITLKLDIQYRVLKYYQICSNVDTGLNLTIFMTWSNLFRNASAWVKAYIAYSHVLIQHIRCIQESDTGPYGPLVCNWLFMKLVEPKDGLKLWNAFKFWPDWTIH